MTSKKRAKFKAIFLIGPLMVLMVSCSKGTNSHPKPTPLLGNESQIQSNEDHASGPSTGGGGYGDESSLFILDRAQKELLSGLLVAEEFMLPVFSQGGTRQSLIEIIKDLRYEPNKKIVRDGRELMFNYAIDEQGKKHLEVLALFFNAHAAVPVNNINAYDVVEYINEAQIKILHEAVHHFGIGTSEDTDKEARFFAWRLYESLRSFHMDCSASEMPDEYFRSNYDVQQFLIENREGSSTKKLWEKFGIKGSGAKKIKNIKNEYKKDFFTWYIFPMRRAGYLTVPEQPDKFYASALTHTYAKSGQGFPMYGQYFNANALDSTRGDMDRVSSNFSLEALVNRSLSYFREETENFSFFSHPSLVIFEVLQESKTFSQVISKTIKTKGRYEILNSNGELEGSGEVICYPEELDCRRSVVSLSGGRGTTMYGNDSKANVDNTIRLTRILNREEFYLPRIEKSEEYRNETRGKLRVYEETEIFEIPIEKLERGFGPPKKVTDKFIVELPISCVPGYDRGVK